MSNPIVTQMHQDGARRYGLLWLDLNGVIADAMQQAGLDPDEPAVGAALTTVARYVLAHFELMPRTPDEVLAEWDGH